MQNHVQIKINNLTLEGSLDIPASPQGIVIFAHGSGSSRHSPRNKYVAEELQKNGFATLLFDLLTPIEDLEYMNRFNINLLSKRLVLIAKWVQKNETIKSLPIGLFGASTGAAAALEAAAQLKNQIKAVVSRGGRPDLADESTLKQIESPVLLIVGGDDHLVIELNKSVFERIKGEKAFNIIKGASHLFEEPGTLEKAAELAAEWFKKFVCAPPDSPQ